MKSENSVKPANSVQPIKRLRIRLASAEMGESMLGRLVTVLCVVACVEWTPFWVQRAFCQEGSLNGETLGPTTTDELPSVLRRRDARPQATGVVEPGGQETARRSVSPAGESPPRQWADPEVPAVPLPTRRQAPAEGPRGAAVVVPAVDRLVARGQAPSVRVDISGPSAVAVGKLVRFQVAATNDGSTPVRDVLVTVAVPNGVELGRVTSAVGETQSATEGNIRWHLPVLGGGERATLDVEVTPQQDAPISFQVDWTLRASAAAVVQVVRPMLQVAIQGPQEVLYGTKQLYIITVSNPGTGPAEGVMLDVSSGGTGQGKKLGTIPPGGQQQVRMELVARDAGKLEIRAVASSENLRSEAVHAVTVRRAELAVSIHGPPVVYAGTNGQYRVQVANVGNATASEVEVSLRLPSGAKYVGGIDGASESGGRLHWRLRDFAPQDQRTYLVDVHFEKAGDADCQVQAALPGELASTADCQTRVEAVADLKLEVNDPQGPKAVGDDVLFEIRVKNRGSKAATDVKILGQFSKGIEPVRAEGAPAEIVPGQVIFAPVAAIQPGQMLTLRIIAKAETAGNHRFRATLRAGDPDVELIAEDVTTFYGTVAGAAPGTVR